jgi:transcriptional regulator with XRE-family HTH domain
MGQWSPIEASELATRIKARRRERGISLRSAATEAGV